MAGPRPKPTHLKALAGNPGKRPLNDSEPKPRPIAPTCPDWLPDEGKKAWAELAPILERLGLLTELDGLSLAALCVHWSGIVDAGKALREGVLIKGRRGQVKHPANQVLRDHSAAFRQFAAMFGLSPADRARLKTPEANHGESILDRLWEDKSG